MYSALILQSSNQIVLERGVSVSEGEGGIHWTLMWTLSKDTII